MAGIPRSRREVGRWWRERTVGPESEGAAMLRQGVLAQHPPFVAAVMADAETAVRRRGESDGFRSRGHAVLGIVRLALVTDSFFAQVCYRAKAACQAKAVPVLPHVFHRLAIVTGQICIGDPVVVHPGVYIPHGQVVADALTQVHSGATLSPFITLGLAVGEFGGPTIGALAEIGTGAKVIGPVTVGARAKVGANAVVVADVPNRATAVGVPARVVHVADASPAAAPPPA